MWGIVNLAGRTGSAFFELTEFVCEPHQDWPAGLEQANRLKSGVCGSRMSGSPCRQAIPTILGVEQFEQFIWPQLSRGRSRGKEKVTTSPVKSSTRASAGPPMQYSPANQLLAAFDAELLPQPQRAGVAPMRHRAAVLGYWVWLALIVNTNTT